MKITNTLHFTENHRFCVYRDFSLSALDYRMLSGIYQPMIGAFAVSIYTTLYGQLPADKAGYSSLEQQRRLFLSLELEPGERGRKFLVEHTSRLEAVGLLETSRKFALASEDYIYEYALFQPLPPNEFFKNQHLSLLLRDKVGKYMTLQLRDEIVAPEPKELEDCSSENLSMPFYEIFRLNTQVIDFELEQALYETASGRHNESRANITAKGFLYSDIIIRFPRESVNREYVEGLKFLPEEMAKINFAAKKYDLTLHETCRLLDEDGMFDGEGLLQEDLFHHRANLTYYQEKKRDEERTRQLAASARKQSANTAEEGEGKTVEMAYYLEVPPLLQGQCDAHQYNMFLRNLSFKEMLKKFFPNGSVPGNLEKLFDKIDLNYRMNEEVINVLIHYIHMHGKTWAAPYIESVATDMLGKQVNTYEQAVEFVRERTRYKDKAANGGASAGKSRGRKKPAIPFVQDTAVSQTNKLTREELDQMIMEAKEKLK